MVQQEKTSRIATKILKTKKVEKRKVRWIPYIFEQLYGHFLTEFLIMFTEFPLLCVDK